MTRQTFKGISNRGRFLLAQQENATVDFKEHIDGVHAEDFVAFANTERGGAILVGVRESVDGSGLQTTEIVGSLVGDTQKLTLINKAASCLPAVEIEVYFENLDDAPFIRVEIPPSSHRPHCTASGTYKIREDGRNKALNPREMLAIFIEKEETRFLSRFTNATQHLQMAIKDLRQDIAEDRELRDAEDKDA